MEYSLVSSVLILLILVTINPVNCARDKLKRKREDEVEHEMSAEKRLIRKLMTVYERVGRAGRPVRNSSVPVTVQFGLGLKQMDLDEKQKILTLSMWTRYEWLDEYLQWNPDDYEGLAMLTVNPVDIWIPDIMLINTADIDVPARSTMAVVNSDGRVSWFPHCIYHSACSVDVTNFPFDMQKCNLAFGSWTHPSREVDIVMSFPGGIDLSTFENENRESSAWDIMNVTAMRRVLPTEEEYPNYAVLTFELEFSRKVVFSTYILTLPCVFLAFLTLVVFWLPPDRPDRTALAMSTFSSFMVLLLILVEAAPPTARTIPTIGVYYCINMVIIVMTVVLSTMVINLSRGPRDKRSRPSKCLKAFTLLGLSRILCMPSIYREVIRRSRANQHCSVKEDTEDRQRMLLPWQRPTNGCDFRKRHTELQASSNRDDLDSFNRTDSTVNNNLCLQAIRSEVELTRTAMERLEQTLHQTRDHTVDDVMFEWRSIAVVLDRFFFVLYLVLIALSLGLFFPRPQQTTEWDD